ncbi:SCA7-domain-containing protein [Mytilinidion resinicola]|uniref:SCA7-domain-containing protein n=1 Tax=Mytilinidion resinicola TaxID=574789 RepID=A0A6A6YBM5_9PEZI|nr:SCA7-domain-containing protein [Mytilinidion resinicola]KAF2806212.1 SCA7-domain-containing protein [Mytilinidion resinicola]
MSANGARTTPAPSSSQPGLVDEAIYKNIFPEHPKGKTLTIKLKKAPPKQTIPGNWKESEVISTNKKSDAASTTPSSPLVNPQDEKTLAAFPTGRPLEDKVDTVQCRHCKRPVLRSVSATHIKDCLNKKQEKLKKKKEAKEAKDAALRKEKGEKDDEGEGGKNNARKSAVKGAAADGDAAKKGKKRKLDGDAEKAPNAKKKKKDEPKAKAAKPKGPVDVEKQCGVALANGGFCARSLTCKSHSMGLKRAVPGRSLPYDMLLAQYQKKNQAKQQRAAIDANAPLAEDLEPQGAVDSDEEKEAVMAAVARARARPLATRTFIPTKSKYQYIRMKDMLHAALSGTRGASLFSTGQPPDPNNMPPSRAMLNGLGMGGGGDFSGNGGGGGPFAPPLSAGLDGPGGQQPGSRRQSVMSNGSGPRQIMPGQLPPPGAQRKASIASVASLA